VGVDSAGVVTAPTQATGDYAYAFGMGCLATGKGAFALGTQNVASGDYSLAMGYNSRSERFYSLASGYKTTASGKASNAMGYGSVASGNFSTAIGFITKATGYNALALGASTIASGYYSTAMGYGSEAEGYYSTAMGSTAYAMGDYSLAQGYFVYAKSYNSVVFGRYSDTLAGSSRNSWVPSDPLFIIGNGTWSNRHNAMLVKKNGEVYFPEVYNSTVGLLRRELYVSIGGKLGYLSSSRRYKKKIRSLEDVQWLYQLRPVSFVYKSDPSGTEQYGLIAEEVEKVNPLFVSYNGKGKVETVSYSQLITPMLKALQEQQEVIERQGKEIKRLKSEKQELASLRQEVEELKQILGAMTEK
jgi:tetratricopeptide (TPR) repeat protein